MGLKTLSGLPAIVAGGLTAIATVQGFTPPPSGQSAIDHAATLTQRNALAAAHASGGSDANFMGFTDTTGWTTTTATNANELATALSGMGVSDQIVITCQWNGESNPTSYALNGLHTSVLTSDGGSPWGYARPTASVLIKAADGYTPALGAAANGGSLGTGGGPLIWEMKGFNYIEWRGIEFIDELQTPQNDSSYPTPPVMAFNNCKIRYLLTLQCPYTLHMEDCYFGQDSGAGRTVRIGAAPRYMRIWNNKFHRMIRSADAISTYGTDGGGGWLAGLDVNYWVAGNTMWNFDGVTDLDSGNHMDIFQYATYTDVHSSYNILFEFNIMAGNGYLVQGFFGNDWALSTSCVSNIVNHNNILVVGAADALWLFDETASGDCKAYRNLLCRGTVLDSTTAIGTYDFVPTLVASNVTDTVAGGTPPPAPDAGGTFDIRENYYALLSTTDASATVTTADNITFSPRAGTVSPNRMQDHLTGNGTWTTDAYGRYTYTAPDAGVTDYATARAAIIAFYKPIAGWNDGTGCGPIDPAEWPTTFGGALS